MENFADFVKAHPKPTAADMNDYHRRLIAFNTRRKNRRAKKTK